MAKSKNEEWVISNNYQVTVMDFNGVPTPNPHFITEKSEILRDEQGNPILDEEGNEQNVTVSVPISESNLPFITQNAFDRFSEFRVGTTYSLSMRQLWNMSAISDDNQGYFDEKENHKTLVQVQTELYERFS